MMMGMAQFLSLWVHQPATFSSTIHPRSGGQNLSIDIFHLTDLFFRGAWNVILIDVRNNFQNLVPIGRSVKSSHWKEC
jgi:hypothetical protein